MKYVIRERSTGGVECADLGWWASDSVRTVEGVCWTRDRSKAQRYSTLELATAEAEKVDGLVELVENGA